MDPSLIDSSYKDCLSFLNHEAELLDDWKLSDWMDLLTEDIDYRVPVRVTRERSGGSGFSESSFFMKEDWGSLKARISRLDSEYSWSEDPPTRTRHFVSNVRIKEGDKKDELNVKTNIMLFRSFGDSTSYDLLSGERHDTLRRAGLSMKLSSRLVLLDHTTLPTRYLSIFL